MEVKGGLCGPMAVLDCQKGIKLAQNYSGTHHMGSRCTILSMYGVYVRLLDGGQRSFLNTQGQLCGYLLLVIAQGEKGWTNLTFFIIMNVYCSCSK